MPAFGDDTVIVPNDVVSFWLQAGMEKWFTHDAAFDVQLRERFSAAHFDAAAHRLDDWLGDAHGALALVLLLDQIPRNIFRDSGHAFATDGLARNVATAAIHSGFDRTVDPALRIFFYLPFEHSEHLADQDHAVALVEALGDALYLRYAIAHRDCIRRFGRFPHRNAALGRVSSADEQAWLDAGGGFG
jgi:uncharacterized protein (DUF924 family)